MNKRRTFLIRFKNSPLVSLDQVNESRWKMGGRPGKEKELLARYRIEILEELPRYLFKDITRRLKRLDDFVFYYNNPHLFEGDDEEQDE
jgi:hypothetical protein